jgi:hypothetical protein
LKAETEQARLDLIRTDLGVCLTLADLAETEFGLGNLQHAEQTLAKAEKGYSDMLRLFSEATSVTDEVESELRSKFKEISERLTGLQRLR